jgi:hypothetical protein
MHCSYHSLVAAMGLKKVVKLRKSTLGSMSNSVSSNSSFESATSPKKSPLDFSQSLGFGKERDMVLQRRPERSIFIVFNRFWIIV